MATGTVDLHTHSIHSDGTWTPTQVVERALSRGLSGLALTDHDSVDGLDEARSRAAGTGLEIIPGVELSAFDGSVEVHVLGYFVDDHDAEFRLSLQQFREQRLLRAHAILERLEQLGFELSWRGWITSSAVRPTLAISPTTRSFSMVAGWAIAATPPARRTSSIAARGVSVFLAM